MNEFCEHSFTSLGWAIVCVIIFLLGCFLGKWHERYCGVAVSPRTEKYQPMITPENAEPDPVASDGQAVGFLNNLMDELWPTLSEFLMKLLKNEVEPQLQSKMPSKLKNIHFHEDCHLGQKPLRIREATCIAEPEQASLLGTYKNVKLMFNLSVELNCELKLVCHVAERIIGSYGEVHVGISNIRFSGTLVIEMVRLMAEKPLLGGFRLFFPNIPNMDLHLNGHFERVLNNGFLKGAIIDSIREKFANLIVLPHCVGRPVSHEVQPFQIFSPCPEGAIRLSVQRLQGFGPTKNMIVILSIGSKRRECHVGSGDVSSFTFKSMYTQSLTIDVYEERHWTLVGNHRGKRIGASRIRLHKLLVDESKMGAIRRIFLVHDVSKQNEDYHCDEFVAGEPSPETVGNFIELLVEWRPCRAAHAPIDFNNFQLRAGGQSMLPDVNSFLLVGLFHVDNLSTADDDEMVYWCELTCKSDILCSLNGAQLKENNVTKTSLEVHRTFSALKTNDERWAEVEMTQEEHRVATARAQFTESIVFPLCGVDSTLLTVKVYKRNKDKHERLSIGWLTCRLSDLASRKCPVRIYNSPLHSFDEQRTEDEAEHHSDVKTLRRSDSESQISSPPSLYMVLKLWTLHSGSAPTLETPENIVQALNDLTLF